MNLLTSPPRLVDLVDHDPEEPVEHRDHLGRVVLGGVRRGARRGRRRARDATRRLAAELDLAQRRRPPPATSLPDVAAEQVAQALALAQPAGHLVEAGLQRAELGAVVDHDLAVELAPARRRASRPHRQHRVAGPRRRPGPSPAARTRARRAPTTIVVTGEPGLVGPRRRSAPGCPRAPARRPERRCRPHQKITARERMPDPARPVGEPRLDQRPGGDRAQRESLSRYATPETTIAAVPTVRPMARPSRSDAEQLVCLRTHCGETGCGPAGAADRPAPVSVQAE